jgi:pSer/pThr/pTyr-binding forkhead associated (FHA) protein
VGDERSPLQPGSHALGGRAPDAIPLEALSGQPRAAILTVSERGVTVLQRTTASIVVRIDGEPIGIAPIELHHGARIEFADCRVIFERDAAATNGSHRTDEHAIAGSTAESARRLTLSVTSTSRVGGPPQGRSSTQVELLTDAALVDVRSGARHPLPARRLYIGRDDSCDVIVRGNSVSRRHASIAPVAGGFLLRDESANGTLVNGVRVVGTYLLGNGDVVRVQDEELRVELDASSPAPIVRGEMTTQFDLSHITRGVTEERARAAANRPPTASLEIVRGPFAGACFQVERAVCSIGRGEENDVRIRDDTVSSAHATLLRKQGLWFVVDLRSMNGTFVDGSRVSGERELHPGARIRLGAVELVFRAIASADPAPVEPPRASLWTRLKDLLRTVAPPVEGH